jgi:hypothetical protein
MMPSSRKGGRHKRKVSHVPVPIPATLAAKLAQESRDRPADAPLLLAPDGKAWRHSRNANHHALFDQAIERAGVDPKTTLYHLRHSSIVRMLLNQVPIAVVARLHDTSVKQIESHYGAYIADYADDVSRPALLDMSTIPPLPAPADRGSTQGECRGCVEADIGPDDLREAAEGLIYSQEARQGTKSVPRRA